MAALGRDNLSDRSDHRSQQSFYRSRRGPAKVTDLQDKLSNHEEMAAEADRCSRRIEALDHGGVLLISANVHHLMQRKSSLTRMKDY
jgi:hypothetical protein